MGKNSFTSRLQLLRFVQDKLNSLSFDALHNKPFARSDAELLSQKLDDAAKSFGIDTLPVEWNEPDDTGLSILLNDSEKLQALSKEEVKTLQALRKKEVQTLKALLKMDVKKQQSLLKKAEELQSSAIVGQSLSKPEQALLNDAEKLQALRKMDAETVLELLTKWQGRIRDAVFDHGELPLCWTLSDANIPPNPIRTRGDLLTWLNGCLTGISETRKRNRSWLKTENCLGDIQRELQNAWIAINAWRIQLSAELSTKPTNMEDAIVELTWLIKELTKPETPTSDETLVSADQLGAFAGVGEKVIRETLKDLNCKPCIRSKGKGNPHQWRYCDAVESLRAVKSGRLRSSKWPDSAAEVMPQKDSSKIPAKK